MAKNTVALVHFEWPLRGDSSFVGRGCATAAVQRQAFDTYEKSYRQKNTLANGNTDGFGSPGVWCGQQSCSTVERIWFVLIRKGDVCGCVLQRIARDRMALLFLNREP